MRNTLILVTLLCLSFLVSPLFATEDTTGTTAAPVAMTETIAASDLVEWVADWLASLFEGTATDDEFGGMTAPGG